ncbi:Outer membrane protein A [Ralstonia psammae]|uniref:Outer membrane protein A n=1 Tax=Ralstonia psammae TaxID=3058598 RepID=A0ABN9J732_9RALS|nr:type VI secretion system protein TssL, long form [Ralstonia sp. LMG 19083]CAJ0803671.1 Outer membrane protein A [Ralstonia sp. LMG 19083]
MNKRADLSTMGLEDHIVAPEQDQPATAAASPQASPPQPARVRRTPWQWQAQETQDECVARILKEPNPLLEAAQPLLRALAEMPENLPGFQEQETQGDDKQDSVEEDAGEAPHPQSAAVALRHLLAEELNRFQQICERANIRRDHILGARYLLCTALDEAAHRKPWGTKGWPQHSLLVSFHQDTEGGNKSFHVLGRLVNSPEEHLELIEVFYQVLSLGFIGRYVNQTDRDRHLDAVRQRLLNLISSKREEVPRELSPHWRGAAPGRFGLLRSIPVWVNIAVLALVAFGLFGWFKYQLMFHTHDVEQVILAIGKVTPPEPPKALRLAELLKGEIARGVVRVDEDATRSDVIFRGDDMFGGGRAEVSRKILPLLDKVAAEISKVNGKVTVIGHSDNVPIKTAKFPSNQALSDERAATVVEYLASKGVAKGRLEAIGKGDTEPVADNKTAAGRAQNRRVEIVVTQ